MQTLNKSKLFFIFILVHLCSSSSTSLQTKPCGGGTQLLVWRKQRLKPNSCHEVKWKLQMLFWAITMQREGQMTSPEMTRKHSETLKNRHTSSFCIQPCLHFHLCKDNKGQYHEICKWQQEERTTSWIPFQRRARRWDSSCSNRSNRKNTYRLSRRLPVTPPARLWISFLPFPRRITWSSLKVKRCVSFCRENNKP